MKGGERPFGLTPEERRQRINNRHWVGAPEPPEPQGRFEEHWRLKYGDAIDCRELQWICSVAYAEGLRAHRAVAGVVVELAEVLQRQWRERRAVLSQHLPGTSDSLRGLSRRERKSFRRLGTPRLGHLGHNLERELVEYERHTRIYLRRVRSHLRAADEPTLRKRGRVEDFALGEAAYGLAKWIRARHQDPQGRLDERTSWADAACCLEWYGWDLSHITSDRSKALERMARRWTAKHVEAER